MVDSRETGARRRRLVLWLAQALVLACFAAVTRSAWAGTIGLPALLAAALGAIAYVASGRLLTDEARTRRDTWAKLAFTVIGIMALLRHPIDLDGTESVPVYEAIARYLTTVDPVRFAAFAGVAMLVKFSGVIASAFAWHLLLIGQGIRFPFWSMIMTSFLIGRFIGTFLPSTLGLDGYTLYEASRYSNQWSRAVTAKALEKIIGITGLFLGMVLTLPFGYAVIVDVTESLGRADAASLLAGAIATLAGGVSVVVLIGLARPGLLTMIVAAAGRVAPGPVIGPLEKFQSAVGAYRGRVGLLMAALVAKFVAHFTTAAVYYFTALAIGVVGAAFWPITFGSTIQILATVLSPTIAGEGAREAFQALLLSKQLGGVAQAVLSAALGFIAAEAATLWGGLFLWTRTPEWRPSFCIVDGRQVRYAWLENPSGQAE
jgi:hypothetical protein